MILYLTRSHGKASNWETVAQPNFKWPKVASEASFPRFWQFAYKSDFLPTLLEFSDNAFVQFYISAHKGSHSDVFKVCLTFFGAWLCSR